MAARFKRPLAGDASPVALSFESAVRDEIISWLQQNWSLIQEGAYAGLEEVSRKIRLLADSELGRRR